MLRSLLQVRARSAVREGRTEVQLWNTSRVESPVRLLNLTKQRLTLKYVDCGITRVAQTLLRTPSRGRPPIQVMGSLAVEAMDIGNVLNNKRFQHHMSSNFMQHHQSHFPIIKPEPGMERSVSPHGSEHSQYSASHQLGRPYPSPSAMQAPMPMSSNAMSLPSYPDMSGMSNMPYQQMPTVGMPTMQQTPPVQQRSPKPAAKNFPCRTCGKPFARRSDLVRHGRSISQFNKLRY